MEYKNCTIFKELYGLGGAANTRAEPPMKENYTLDVIKQNELLKPVAPSLGELIEACRRRLINLRDLFDFLYMNYHAREHLIKPQANDKLSKLTAKF